MPGSLNRGEGREFVAAFTVPGPTYLAAVLREGLKRLSDARIAELCESEQSPGACQDLLKGQRDLVRTAEEARVWFPIQTSHDAELAWKSPGFGVLTSAALLFDGGEITVGASRVGDILGFETALDLAYTRFNKAMAGRIGAAEETRDGTVALFRVGVVVAKQTRLGYMFRVASSSLYDDLGGRAYLQQSITL